MYIPTKFTLSMDLGMMYFLSEKLKCHSGRNRHQIIIYCMDYGAHVCFLCRLSLPSLLSFAGTTLVPADEGREDDAENDEGRESSKDIFKNNICLISNDFCHANLLLNRRPLKISRK